MIFVINDLKYDTDKMELVSEKCEYIYTYTMFKSKYGGYGKDVQLWKSVHGRYLLTYNRGYSTVYSKTLTEQEAMNLLKKYDLDKYEALFGELEEA